MDFLECKSLHVVDFLECKSEALAVVQAVVEPSDHHLEDLVIQHSECFFEEDGKLGPSLHVVDLLESKSEALAVVQAVVEPSDHHLEDLVIQHSECYFEEDRTVFCDCLEISEENVVTDSKEYAAELIQLEEVRQQHWELAVDDTAVQACVALQQYLWTSSWVPGRWAAAARRGGDFRRSQTVGDHKSPASWALLGAPVPLSSCTSTPAGLGAAIKLYEVELLQLELLAAAKHVVLKQAEEEFKDAERDFANGFEELSMVRSGSVMLIV